MLAPALLAGAVMLHAGSVSAAPVSCPGTATTADREFTLDTTPDATCTLSGTGNISGDPSNDDFLIANPTWTLIDKSDGPEGIDSDALSATTGSLNSGLSGEFSISIDPALSFSSLAIGFKSGQGQLDPDWAIFTIDPGVTSGSWTISGSQQLSHTNLYGLRSSTNVPLPATALLLCVGLGGLAMMRRRGSATI